MMNLLRPLDPMPLVEFIPQFIAGLRDKMAATHGRRAANYVMAVVSVASEHGKEQGYLKDNPVRGVKRVRRARGTPAANRPWTEAERQVVLDQAPVQLRVPIALAMFTGLRKGDILKLTKSAIRNGKIWRRTSKTGQEVSIPVHPDLARLFGRRAGARRRYDRSHDQRHAVDDEWLQFDVHQSDHAAGETGGRRRSADVPRAAPHSRHTADRGRCRHRHGAAVAWPEDVGHGDPLFGDSRCVGQDARNNGGARPARDQRPNKSV